jgi:hypothetical protein
MNVAMAEEKRTPSSDSDKAKIQHTEGRGGAQLEAVAGRGHAATDE